MRISNLYHDASAPYYVIAPPYTEMSSEVKVLHYLCHALNVNGQEAYVSTAATNESLRTPVLTESIVHRHKSAGREPIVIYPGAVSGNPLGMRNAVRYLLNQSDAEDFDISNDGDQFILRYTPHSSADENDIPAAASLYLPVADPLIFNVDGIDESGRQGACFYRNRYSGPISEVPEDAVEISSAVARTPTEMASIFRSTEVLYLYEPSIVALEARLCGCAVVYVPNETFLKQPPSDPVGLDGIAWGSAPEGIRKARETVRNIRSQYDKLIEKFTFNLEAFVQKSQQFAQGKSSNTQEQEAASEDDSWLSVALEIGRELGERLDRVVTTMAEKGRLPVADSAEKSALFCRAAEYLIDNDRSFDVFSSSEPTLNDRLEQVDGADSLLHEVLERGENKDRATNLQARSFKARQNLRYQRWIGRHALQEVDGHLFAERMSYQWRYQPVFHIVVFMYPGEEALLGDTLDSLSEQLYQDWRLTVVADSPAPDPLWDEIDTLHWLHCGAGEDPYVLVNQSINSVKSDWVSFVSSGTRWRQHALLRLGDYANKRPAWKFIYSDYDSIDTEGKRSDPCFLPDLNLDMLRSTPYCQHGSWISCEQLQSLGGVEPRPSLEMHDLALKVIESAGEDAVGHIADILVHIPEQSATPDDAVLGLVVRNHLERSGVPATVGSGYLPGTLRVSYVHAENTSVSIIIPTLDRFTYLESCVNSLQHRTDYENFEIIICDRGSTDPDTLEFYRELEASTDGAISVLRFDEGTSVASACNLGAAEARGDYLVFLRDHVEARQALWLERMLSHAQRPEVGIVGPRIVQPESTLLAHTGMVLGFSEVAGMPFVSQLTLQGSGYMGRAQIDQNFSAVSDACLMIRKSLFDQVGGMDASVLGKNFLDVDLSLRVGEAGYKIVWTPYAMLMAYKGTATLNERDKGVRYMEDAIAFNKDREAIFHRWLPRIANDPAYNPNLDLTPDGAFLVSDQLPLNWDVNFHERTRILGLPVRGGSGEYRIIQPFEALSHAALQQTEYFEIHKDVARSLSLASVARLDPDVFVVQAAISDMQIDLLEDLSQFRPDIFRIFTLDDLLTEIPEKSSVYRAHVANFRNARARIRKALSRCDRMIVTTRPLADAYADMIEDIRVIPNRLRRDVWMPLESQRRMGKRPRVGWVGAHQHGGDLEIIIDVVKATAGEIDWIFMGMCPKEIRPYVKEFHEEWVAYEEYPRKMASLNLDIAVAPLEIHSFNEAKSNLRLLEYGALGWPVVCTDIAPYQAYDAPVRRVPNEKEAWIDAIMSYAHDLDKAARDGDRLRSWVRRHFILEDHLDEWMRALTPVNSRVSAIQTKANRLAG